MAEGRLAGGRPALGVLPPQTSGVAEVKNTAWGYNPIDAFVLARLEASTTAIAARRQGVLTRELRLDRIAPPIAGLDAFLKDTSPDAYEKAVDRLLASPRYGEHMALSWMEASQYADTDSYQNDRLRYVTGCGAIGDQGAQ